MTQLLSFFVAGDPKPAGSKRPYFLRNKDRTFRLDQKGNPMVNVVDDSGSPGKRWRAVVAKTAMVAWRGQPLLDAPLRLSLVFYLVRPKGHFTAHGTLRMDAPAWPTVKPDALKLARSVEDALSGVVYVDDARVVEHTLSKEYVRGAYQPGVSVAVFRLS